MTKSMNLVHMYERIIIQQHTERHKASGADAREEAVRRVVYITLVLSVMVMAFSGVAMAATAQDIYNDYAGNGKLDGTYTNEELRAYLNDATVAQYADTATKGELDTLVTSMLNKHRGEFPFTGMELGMFLLGAAVLVGSGVALRRATR